VLKHSRHLVTIDAPSERRLVPSEESSGEDIFIWFRRRRLNYLLLTYLPLRLAI